MVRRLRVCEIPSEETIMNLKIFTGDRDSVIVCIATKQPPFFRTVVDAGIQLFVHVPKGFGNRLVQHLATYGIEAIVHAVDGATFDRLEIDGDNYPDDVQEAVDRWQD